MASLTISTLYRPTPGRAREAAQLVAECVKASEPYTISHEIIKDSNRDQPAIVVVQTFKSQAALTEHLTTPAHKDGWQTLVGEGLLSGAPQVFTAYPISNYVTRRRIKTVGFDSEF